MGVSPSGKRADHVGAEAGPMLIACDNDRNLAIAKALDEFQS
jgi:hypothetical protein